jgi:hypothetical protein
MQKHYILLQMSLGSKWWSWHANWVLSELSNSNIVFPSLLLQVAHCSLANCFWCSKILLNSETLPKLLWERNSFTYKYLKGINHWLPLEKSSVVLRGTICWTDRDSGARRGRNVFIFMSTFSCSSFFFLVLRFELRAYTLSHSTRPFLWWVLSR